LYQGLLIIGDLVKDRILVVEDQAIILMELKARLNNLGYMVVGTSSYGEDAIKKAELLRPDLVLMDIGLRGKVDGIEAADYIRRNFNIPIIFLTANSDGTTRERANATEPYGFIPKPYDQDVLTDIIDKALYKHKLDTSVNETLHGMEISKETAIIKN
jgi:DNA-binding NarL/FixJ family response regulator